VWVVPSRKRSLIVTCVVVLLLGGLAAWWSFWVPNWRPALREGERYGIDVSAHQGDINWHQVADDDISFAYIKATEGGDFVDKRYLNNFYEALGAGVDPGAYHFFTLCSPGAIQAQNFLHVGEPHPAALPPAVDLELSGNCGERPSEAQVARELDEFIEIVEEEWEREMVVYVLPSWEELYPTAARLDRPLWIHRFLLRPSEDWAIWRLHGNANIEGIEGNVDLNVGRESIGD
jgi:lysozyme